MIRYYGNTQYTTTREGDVQQAYYTGNYLVLNIGKRAYYQLIGYRLQDQYTTNSGSELSIQIVA